MDRFQATITVLVFMIAITGMLLLLVAPKSDERLRRLGIGFFTSGMAGIAGFFLLHNPNILESAQEHIALTLIGMVIATISVIKLLKK